MRSLFRSYCFYRLFYGCTNISDCSSLTLQATTLAEGCYMSMFSSCSALMQAPSLPATTLADSCYMSMFEGCTALTQAPSLPATTLAESCYYSMFAMCTALTQAPEIKTYTPDLYAYAGMLDIFNSITEGQFTCIWSDLTLSEVERMVLNESIFGYINFETNVRISITCKDGSGIAYYNSENWSWVFEY